MAALIERYLPSYDVRERHRIEVHAPPAATFDALWTADLAQGFIVGTLLTLRALPAALMKGASGLPELRRSADAPVTLADFERRGFRILASKAPDELVIGLEGQFWRAGGDLCTPPDAEAFLRHPPAAGTARAVWNFRVTELCPNRCALATETRVLCASAAVRRRFLPYWWLIRPGSGLIRRAMLRAIREEAERGDPVDRGARQRHRKP